MRIASRLAVYAVTLVVAFGAAFGLGRAVGPVEADAPADPRPTIDGAPEHGDADHGVGS